MTWDLGDQEFESVRALPAQKRYEYFIKRAASHGELYGLRDETGWVTGEDKETVPHLAVWPHARFALACADGPWAKSRPVAIDIDDWVTAWLPQLSADGMRIAVFQVNDDRGTSIGAARLRRDLERGSSSSKAKQV